MILNPAQEKAVRAPNKPTLVLAGAGTGKTRVLIERIIKLINEDQIDHRRILIITFTNKARDEIKSRIATRVGDNRIPPNLFTFHGFFHKLLIKDVEKIDPKFRNFKVIDETDQRSIVRRLLKPLSISTDDLKSWEPRCVVSAISKLKNCSNNLEDEKVVKEIAKEQKVTKNELVSIFNLYQEELRNNNFFDYDDLEVFTFRALQNDTVREYWRNWFDSILIDEFQDTSKTQIEIVKLLVDKNKGNIFCVGDPDQSIYGFRGAKPRVCSEFLEYFNAECIKLEENYRSTQNILDVSNYLIRKNHIDQKLFKELRSAKQKEGRKVQCIRFSNEWDEVEYVVNEISKLRALDKSCRLKDIVILYRNNALSRPFEITLNERKIDCEITNSVDFFSRLEIRFVVAFLRLLFFHEEAGSGIYISNIADELKIGVGEGSCHNFCEFMKENNYKFLEAVENIDSCSGVNAKAKKGIIQLYSFIKELIPIRERRLDYILDEIVRITGYEESILEKKELGRLENIKRFGESIALNEDKKTNKEIVEEISLRSKDVKRSKSDDFLLLSTVHQAKGLEYKYVFVVRMTQKLFPSYLSVKPEEIEEERRLAYVAFTRAKEGLYITSSPFKNRRGGVEMSPSIFMEELRNLKDKVILMDRRKEFNRRFF